MTPSQIRSTALPKRSARREAEQESDRPKEVTTILEQQTEAGLEQYHRRPRQIFLSAITAGMEVGFSVLFMGVLYTLYADDLSEASLTVVLAFAYPIGFLFVVIGRSELFTEHTDLALLPVLAGRASVPALLRLWGIILAGNLLGGYVIGLVIVAVGPNLGALEHHALEHLALKMVRHEWWVVFSSGILAGWLMGLLTWLITASQETISRMLVVILVTIVIGIAGLHHSIVGSIEVFAGALVSPEIGWTDYGYFQVLAVLGNVVGGGVFVALFKFGQARRQ